MITGVNHFTLAVSDLSRSVRFYIDILGAHLRADWSSGAYLELGELWLCLVQSAEPVIPRSDYTHLALSCEPTHFLTFSTRISEAATLWQDNVSEGASLYFLDPDGHKLELHHGNLNSRLAHYRAHPEKGVQLYK